MSDTEAARPRRWARRNTAPSKKKNNSDPSGGGSIAALRETIRGCAKCPALVRSRSQAVPGAGAIPADIAFVGIAPGRFGGDRTGLPFNGDRSGQLLARMISDSGLRRVFITNLVRCNPRDAGGRNRDPSRREIANCRAFLNAELAHAKPTIIACLGRLAWRELAGRSAPFTPFEPVTIGGVTFFPMYHPAYVVRGAYSSKEYARDFARLSALLVQLTKITQAR